MTKAQLVSKVAERTGLTRKQVLQVVDTLFGVITETLSKKRNTEPVNITGFGRFAVRQRPARVVRNPRTGETMRKPASRVPVFRPAKQLKQAVSGS
ncbi:DNA-binding protein HU [bacterium HR17]|jgi:DNA-binding protein HU-beta|uniref:DNA-binding protein HU n=1 Tax=Candidatus Fervidibacter japonicus TaxID=2035412 RepID=A0A2H5XBX0_9BACT|nr:DNA-binding protein HU [bacterium HR17]